MMYRVQIFDWDRRRDFFPAHAAAVALNVTRSNPNDRIFEANDFLLTRYPALKPKVEHDPDHGAMGDWKGLRQALRGRTETQVAQKLKLKPHA